MPLHKDVLSWYMGGVGRCGHLQMVSNGRHRSSTLHNYRNIVQMLTGFEGNKGFSGPEAKSELRD